MNDKLLTHDGGQPFLASDFSFMQNALLASIGHLSRANGDRYILWGVLSEDKQSIVEGAVVIDGNVYQVPALGAINSQYLCFKEREYDEREFENGSTNNVKLAVDVYLSTDPSGAIAYVRAEQLLTPQALNRQALFEVKEVTGDTSSLDPSFQIDFEEPIDLNIGDIVIANLLINDNGRPAKIVSTTSMAIVEDRSGENTATLRWTMGNYAQTYSLNKNGVKYVYTETNPVAEKITGTVTLSFIVIKL